LKVKQEAALLDLNTKVEEIKKEAAEAIESVVTKDTARWIAR